MKRLPDRIYAERDPHNGESGSWYDFHPGEGNGHLREVVEYIRLDTFSDFALKYIEELKENK